MKRINRQGIQRAGVDDRPGRIPISDNQNSLKSGARNPTLLEDFCAAGKNLPFRWRADTGRIVHARDPAAHGFFEVYESLSSLTRADLFFNAKANGRLSSCGFQPSSAALAPSILP